MFRIRNWWARAFGRGRAWDEGRDLALCNAAMVAHDMGRPDIRRAINQLMPKGSVYRPNDTPPGSPYDQHPMSLADGVGQ